MKEDLPRAHKRCLSCGEVRAFRDMRLDGVMRGSPPDTCKECRSAHPGMQWCNYHKSFEEEYRFQRLPNSKRGFQERCKEAVAIAKGKKGYKITFKECEDCLETLEAGSFWSMGKTGGLRPVCKNCENGRPGEKRCVDCKEWKSLKNFTSKDPSIGKFTIRCNPCNSAFRHGVTVKEILRRQGSSRSECGACGDTGNLFVDHDHSCCDRVNGCWECVRGYLCRECNIAEGHLKDSRTAEALARYMRRHEKS